MNNSYRHLSTLHLPVRWVDLDAYGHVNNSKYFDYMSETRITLFGEEFLASHLHFVVAETHCTYKKSFLYPSTIIVEQYLQELGRTYLIFYYAFYREGDNLKTLHASCSAKIVCVDPQTAQVTRLPANILALIK